jgi:hypothetical protein
LLDLHYLKSEVARCFPERYHVMDIFRNKYESHLVVEIGALYQVRQSINQSINQPIDLYI